MCMKFDCNDNRLTQQWSGAPDDLAAGTAAIIASIYSALPEGARETFREALSVFVDGDDAPCWTAGSLVPETTGEETPSC